MSNKINLSSNPYNGLLGDINLTADINNTVEFCYGRSFNAGWHTDLETGQTINPVPFFAKMCLIFTELAEAIEGHRKNLMDDHLPNRLMVEVELADACIRIFDLAGAMGLDLGGAIAEKLEYNLNRADHKIENRLKDNGKKF